MSVLTATALSGGGEAGLLGIAGVAVSALAGLLSLFEARRQRRVEAPRGSVHWTDWEPDLGGLADADEAGEQPGVQRRVQTRAVLPPALSAATVRTIVREELAVVREDINKSGRRAFWSGFGQGLLFYVCGVGFTLIISG